MMTPLSKTIIDGAAPDHRHMISITSPVTGAVKSLDDLPESVIKARLMGDGIAVIASGYQVYAPFSGKISSIDVGSQQVMLACDNGLHIMLQVGLNAKEWEHGCGFKIAYKLDAVIAKNDLLFEFDIARFRRRKTPAYVIMTILNSEKLVAVQPNIRKAVACNDEGLKIFI